MISYWADYGRLMISMPGAYNTRYYFKLQPQVGGRIDGLGAYNTRR
jgi:hypothetical protein